MSMSVKGLEPVEGGNWEMSGMESHMMTRFVVLDEDEEGWTAIQMLEEMARDFEVSGVEELVDVRGGEGREVNDEFPA
jgi:hypothetical protein